MKALFVDNYKHLYWIVHRRAGKTKTAVNILCMKAIQEAGLYLLLLPQTNQCRRVVWNGRGSDGVRFIDHVPKKIIHKINNADMSITLYNGSVIQLVGSNNFDALMGINSKFIIYDEYPLQNPLARQYLSPILLESGGTELILGTPRGHNHGYDTYQTALNNDDWFLRKLTVDHTFRDEACTVPVITNEQIAQEKRNGMSSELIEQEFYVSFDIGNLGAYYTEEIAQAEYEGRICDFELIKSQPVYTSWDIGVSDSTSICFFQQDGYMIKFIAYYENNNKGIDHYAQILDEVKKKLGFNRYGYHFAPHDIEVREWGNSARSRLVSAREYGINFIIAPRLSIQDRIAAGRSFMSECIFHKTNCAQLLTCLREAMREYDEVTKVFKNTPLHNWALHGFDSYTYGATAWRHGFARPDLNAPIKFNNAFMG